MQSRRMLMALLPLLFLLMAFRQSPLIDPAPLPVPPQTTVEQVAKAIKAALLHREWTITSEQPGEIGSTLHLRDHIARITITYDTREIRIRYVDSSNLKYEVKRNGTRLIHSNYAGWIQNLVADVRQNLLLFGA